VPIGALICYDVAFGAEVADLLPTAQLLVNLSNDAWFGDSLGPHQHLQIAQMRAIETGRPLLRSTNTGLTAVIDHNGQLLARAPQFEPTVLQAEVTPRTGSTPYVRWRDKPVLAFIGLALSVLVAIRKKSKRNSSHLLLDSLVARGFMVAICPTASAPNCAGGGNRDGRLRL